MSRKRKEDAARFDGRKVRQPPKELPFKATCLLTLKRFILYAARSETLSNTWKLSVMREASLSWCLVGSRAMLF